MTIFGNFFGQKCQVFGNFLTVKWQFLGGSALYVSCPPGDSRTHVQTNGERGGYIHGGDSLDEVCITETHQVRQILYISSI